MAQQTAAVEAGEHPRIWVSSADREAIVDKIENKDWAASMYAQLFARVDPVVSKHQADRDAFVKGLPLDWTQVSTGHPPFRYITGDESDRFVLMGYLQDAIECGVVYYLSGDEKYAQAAADVMGTVVSALARMQRSNNASNGGLVYPNDHLKEARIFGAQIPVACDFIYPFVMQGATVYDVATGAERDFPFEDAQKVFKTYAEMAINVGHSGSNWSVLESPSLVGNTLMLDSEEEINQYLPYYLDKNTTRQDPLSVVAESFAKPGDIWPESLQYSMGVTEFSIILMGILDRLYPDLDLAQAYPNIMASAGALHNLRFPNEDFPSFGDGHRYYDPPYRTFENAYYLASLANDTENMFRYGSLIKSGIAKGLYNRSTLPPQSNAAHVYSAPLKLLWSVPDLIGEERDYPRTRTVELPFAGIFIQRNESTADPEKDGLMLFVGGAGYVHGHASGMNVEFYGQGEVLGIDGGVGTYRSDSHENYYRLFAAHNTVISNGGSAGSGGWVNLGIETVQLKAMEPMPGEAAVSPSHSFSTTTFHDRFNIVRRAEHERTLALIRTSPTRGYYVDIFRARSNDPRGGEFHDYIYRNIGETLTFTETPLDFSLSATPDRFEDSTDLPWSVNSRYRHPGWHYFMDVETASSVSDKVVAQFNILRMPDGIAAMDVHMNAGDNRSYSKAKSPSSRNATSSYVSALLPTIIVRQEGKAWANPFAFVYESYSKEDQGPAIQSVDRLMEGSVFKGLVVESEIEGQTIRQYILNLDDPTDTYTNTELGLTFTGHFGVVTTGAGGDLVSLYIGHGDSLQYGGTTLTADPVTKTAFQDETQGSDQWIEHASLGWVEYSEFPYIYSINLNGWLYSPADSIDGSQQDPWFYIFKR
jgi:hypothetical protein